MEENTAAVECLILFYINTKHILKTKQLDERVFLDQMIRHCRESGFDGYSNEEIRNTWRNITSKYVELKKTGTPEMRETWKYYEILDSCFEQSDFHNGVYPKFSEEMVWFLIECFLKRKHSEKTQKKNSMLNEIHKEFLQCGYLYITRQDIENKWKYLNAKYDKIKDDTESLKKLPYLQALKGFREKSNDCPVKMIFTRMLTEILIERFTEKKITCVIHGYDSEQVLSEIQSEFKDLGFDFTQEEIKERWTKLTNIYAFLKAKGKHDSSWVYFSAMREHFKDDYLSGFGNFEMDLKAERRERHNRVRQRSKSVGADARSRCNSDELIVNIPQLHEMSPKKCREEKKPRVYKRKQFTKRPSEEKSPKRSRARSKSRDSEKTDKNKDDDQTKSASVIQPSDFISRRKNNRLKHLSIDRNITQERRGSSDLGSPGSKVHIINIDESTIDKKSGNITINLPSITKQFSDNEFLPLKKRLRLDGEKSDKNVNESKDIKDGFLGFPSTETGDARTRLKSDEVDGKRLTEDEMEEILKRIHEDKPENNEFTNSQFSNNQNYYKPGDFNYNSSYQQPYNNFNPPCLLIPKEEQPDNLALQQSYSPSTITPPPVLLLVIKVDGNNPKDSSSEDKKKTEKDLNASPSSSELLVPNNLNVVKPISPKKEHSPVVKNENMTIVNSKNIDVNLGGTQTSKGENEKPPIGTNPIGLGNLQLNTNGLINLVAPTGKSCSITLNENVTFRNTEAVEVASKSVETVQTPTTVVKSEEKPVFAETTPLVGNETSVPAASQEPCVKRIRLPVKGGGNVKEIFISPRELKKLAKIKPGDFKPTTSPIKNNESIATSPIKNTPTVNTTTHINPPKIKFISQVIKPPTVKSVVDSKPENIFQKPRGKVNVAEPATDVNCMLPPPAVTASKFLGSNNSVITKNMKSEEFETESVFSEAVGDDEGLKDNLLATVIDFQEQNNQEFVEIKNLMKQNNLLQRETNRLLRLMLEKM